MIANLTSPNWLLKHIEEKEIIILHVIQNSSVEIFNSTTEELKIKGAIPFDLSIDFSDTNSPYPNTIPSPTAFETQVRKLGIKKTSRIVVYDELGIYLSPRVWWMFKLMGHQNITVLNGGLPLWEKLNYLTESKSIIKPFVSDGDFVVNYNTKNIKLIAQIFENIATKEFTIVDARSSDRFNSLAPEPRKELRRGNITGSINIPYETVLTDSREFKSKYKLLTIFNQHQLAEKKLVYSCGSGITACILALAFNEFTTLDFAVYDGSWSEWAQCIN